MTPEREWFITVAIQGDPTRTQDFRIQARNAYNARWLWTTIHPTHQITQVRPTTRSTTPTDPC